MLGVMTVGVLMGVLVAVGLAMLKLLLLASKPHDAVLGVVPGKNGFTNIAEDPTAKSIPGVVVYRFDSSLLFFNADHFANRVRQIVREVNEKPDWFVLDAEAMPILDTTGADVLASLRDELLKQEINLSIARPKGLFRMMLDRTGVAGKIGRDQLFPSVRAAVEAAVRETSNEEEKRGSTT
jgi:MFS superfamily sulfate permease-like transporter